MSDYKIIKVCEHCVKVGKPQEECAHCEGWGGNVVDLIDMLQKVKVRPGTTFDERPMDYYLDLSEVK